MSSPNASPDEFRLKLNNFLQAHGCAARLSWSTPINNGPDHAPSWIIYAFFDGNQVCHGTGRSKDRAKEVAAEQVLKFLAPGRY